MKLRNLEFILQICGFQSILSGAMSVSWNPLVRHLGIGSEARWPGIGSPTTVATTSAPILSIWWWALVKIFFFFKKKGGFQDKENLKTIDLGDIKPWRILSRTELWVFNVKIVVNSVQCWKNVRKTKYWEVSFGLAIGKLPYWEQLWGWVGSGEQCSG